LIQDRSHSGGWWLATKNLVFPQFCGQCGVHLLTEENGYYCPECWLRSPRIHAPFCTGCGQPHPEMRGLGEVANYPCAECRERPHPHVDRIYGAAVYDDAIADAVRKLKFNGKQRLAGPMAEVMAAFADEYMEMEQYESMVPVPLHRVRERARGFNQSRLLTEAFALEIGGLAVDESLKRIRPTKTQSRLKAAERAANVRGAFAVVGDALDGKRVLLIDDVVTSAGTVVECARVLKLAGAAHVDVLAAALAVKQAEW